MFRVKKVQLAFMEQRTYGRYIYKIIYEKSAVRLASVGLAQARPNYNRQSNYASFLIWSQNATVNFQ